MNLHVNKDLFKTIILQTEQASRLTSDIIEKDYYVTFILKELSLRQNENHAFLKGGTALYKAIRGIRRFSEDIDLTVSVDGLTGNKARKRLEASVYNYALILDKKDVAHKEGKGSITAVYRYETAFNDLSMDKLQRFEKILIEATSFTVSEPTTEYIVAPLLYDLTTEKNKEILENQYNIKPFSVKTITLERIFIDKLFAAEFYYLRQNWFDVAKHIYDIAVLSEIPSIKELFKKRNNLDHLILLKREEELSRKGGIPKELRIKDFAFINGIRENLDFKRAFLKMQEKYVLKAQDHFALNDALNIVSQIFEEI